MIEVKTELCIGCGACVRACTVNAIHLREGKAYIEGSKCTDCQKCIQICPEDALEVIEPVFSLATGSTQEVQVLPVRSPVESDSGNPNWKSVAFNAFFQQVFPRLVDAATTYLENRLVTKEQDQEPIQEDIFAEPIQRRRRQRRGRC
jgi:Fe-S-cluster-containing hydrogenase component 2